MIYYMSKTESEQWRKNQDVETDNKGFIKSNIKTTRTKCRDLIRDIAKERGCGEIADDTGATVEG